MKSDAPTTAPPADAVKDAPAGEGSVRKREAAQRALFVGMALEMSWQLAVVVIVPIVGGYMADSRFHTAPWLTLAGLALAAGGVFGVLLRIVREADRRVTNIQDAKPKPKGTPR